MIKAQEEDDLGPLPQTNRNAEIQRMSFAAIQSCLPTDKFVFRDERIEDAGVDASLELLVGSGNSNLRAQAQLKGTDSDEYNVDGSFSLQVDVSNLNYLLNGVCPIYLLYIITRKEFRYIWARDERRRLDRDNPGWVGQKTVTLRFLDVLTPEAVDNIYKRILREGRMHRKIHDALAAGSLTEEVSVSIDPNTLSTTSPEEAYLGLLKGGFTAVASGYALQVVQQARLLSSTQAGVPRIQLVLAYAEYVMGRYSSAISHLQQTALRRTELAAEDQQFMTYLQNVCNFHSGRIDLAEYCRRVDEWEQLDKSGFALANRLDSTRYKLLNEADIGERNKIFSELKSVASEVLKRADSSTAFKLEAVISLLYADGGEHIIASFQEIVGMPLRRALQIPVDIKSAQERLLNLAWSDWEQSLKESLLHAANQRQPLLEGFALITRTTVRTNRLINLRFLADCTGAYIEIPETLRLETMSDAEHAMKIFEQAGQLEGVLRAKIYLADLYLLAGQSAAAQALARDVLPQAEAMDYATLIERAKEHIEGKAIPDRLRAAFEHASTADEDLGLAYMTDEEARAFALDVHTEREIPIERLPVAEQDVFALRDISRERLCWCRHINLIQDLTHTQSMVTIYTTDLKHDGECEKYGYRTNIGKSNWQEVIASFKREYCQGCPSREPKQQPSA
jgi:hypothetical protein